MNTKIKAIPKTPKEHVLNVFKTGDGKKITTYLKAYYRKINYYKSEQKLF